MQINYLIEKYLEHILIKKNLSKNTFLSYKNDLIQFQKVLNLNSHQEVGNKMIELQNEYWPDAKREFYPIDIEYQSCECRKYFSYVNGTKKFEGKNLFSL